jgi:hypothetical protein
MHTYCNLSYSYEEFSTEVCAEINKFMEFIKARTYFFVLLQSSLQTTASHNFDIYEYTNTCSIRAGICKGFVIASKNMQVVKYVNNSICHEDFHQLISNKYIEQMHTCICYLSRNSILSQFEEVRWKDILSECEALTYLRLRHLGRYFMEPSDN